MICPRCETHVDDRDEYIQHLDTCLADVDDPLERADLYLKGILVNLRAGGDHALSIVDAAILRETYQEYSELCELADVDAPDTFEDYLDLLDDDRDYLHRDDDMNGDSL